MAANDPGLAPLSAPAEDPKPDAAQDIKDGIVHDERPVAPDQFDEKYETTRLEVW